MLSEKRLGDPFVLSRRHQSGIPSREVVACQGLVNQGNGFQQHAFPSFSSVRVRFERDDWCALSH